MNGRQVREEIGMRRDGSTRFIKWWRKENDFVDYELLDKFLKRLDINQEFSGFELLDMEEMWQTLKTWAGDKVSREHRTHGDMIIWHKETPGVVEVEELPFTPDAIMVIFDVETKGDTIQ